jgi:dolichol-phosphate mannosyltransferase
LILIPTLNEAKGIGKVLDDIPIKQLECMGHNISIVLVDGNSSDDTAKIAEDKNAHVYIQTGTGKGTGIRQVFTLTAPTQAVLYAATLSKNVDKAINTLSVFLDSDYIIMIDGDDTYPAYEIPEFINKLERGHDVVMGSRLKGKREHGAMTSFNHMGNIILSAMATVIYTYPVSDVCTGMWGFRKEALNKLYLDAKYFDLEAEMFAESVKTGLKITEVPIEYRRRKGETKLMPMKNGVSIALKLFKRRIHGAGI